MPQQIHKRFIDEAVRIRTEYFRQLQALVAKEKSIQVEKNNLELIITELHNRQEQLKEEDLPAELLRIESHITRIEKEYLPIQTKIKELESDAKKLGETIRSHYSLSDEQIKEQLDPHLDKIKI
jgi:peptidoglycan hydrolase CwlO-like protein